MEEINYYTREEVAQVLRVTTRTIDNYIKAGLLHCTKFPGAVRISLADVKQFILDREQARVDAAKADAGLS